MIFLIVHCGLPDSVSVSIMAHLLALNLLLLMYGKLLNNVAILWSAYHCVHGTSCLCTSSIGAIIEPSLHHLCRFLF